MGPTASATGLASARVVVSSSTRSPRRAATTAVAATDSPQGPPLRLNCLRRFEDKINHMIRSLKKFFNTHFCSVSICKIGTEFFFAEIYIFQFFLSNPYYFLGEKFSFRKKTGTRNLFWRPNARLWVFSFWSTWKSIPIRNLITR